MTTPKTRSLGGCSTCRRSHIKCDERRPACLACERIGVECGGYETRITFAFEWCDVGPRPQSEMRGKGQKFRRPLFTEEYRQRMSKSLMRSIPADATHDMQAFFDTGSARFEGETRTNLEVVKGPFTIFRAGATAAATAAATSQKNNTSSLTDMPDVSGSPHQDEQINEIVPPISDIELDFFPDDHGGTLNPDLPQLMSTDLFFSGDLSSSQPLHASMNDTSYLVMERGFLDVHDNALFAPGLSFPISQAPSDAPSLLYHYQDSVIPLFSPLKYHKTPWNTLFMPNAMKTLAALTMGLPPNNASLCIFQALLSISAFHIAATGPEQQAQYWKPRANYYLHLAQQTLKVCLADQGAVPKRVKYKETLMALLSMVTASTFAGNWKHTRCYLLDADSLIRQRGLSKPHKSRKVRLLHHCYTYARIIHESTFIMTPNLKETTVRSSLSIEQQDRSPLRARKWDGRLDQRLSMDKNSAEGLDDILLAIPGRWEPTLYPAIYGVPESFLVLLSETTRLANERHALQQCFGDCNLTWSQYLLRAKVLEKCICSWESAVDSYPQEIATSASRTMIEANCDLVKKMMLALHQALLIYFYRRIHDIDPMILQDRVGKALSLLLECEETYKDTGQCAATFAWTGFVAACEALSQDVQDKFSAWFRRCSRRSGITTFEASHQLAQQIWQQRREHDDVGISWLQLVEMRSSHLCFV